MLKDGKILIGKAGEKEVCLLPSMLNRHGLIAGSTGTGKTVTLKVIAESLSELGVPTFICDIKSDLSGMIVEGDLSGIQERLDSMGIEGFETRKYPVHFFDVSQKLGHALRSDIDQYDRFLLSRVLGLSEAQEGVLNIIFEWAQEFDPDENGEGLDVNDIEDLEACCDYVSDHADEISAQYGNVTKQSVAAIKRKLLQLKAEQGGYLFGLPALEFDDLLETQNGLGVMSILECEKLFQDQLAYSTFLVGLLDGLYNHLPEVGDLEKPKLVLFFEESHLMFKDAPKRLVSMIEQTVKLIRSKGVSVFFCTQTPTDIPDSVLAQLSNRIQHSLRAYTPAELEVVKKTAKSFRANPELNTEEELTSMKVGTALVSVLDEDGAPTIVEKTKILPPKSSMNRADESLIISCINNDGLSEVYDDKYGDDNDDDYDAARELADYKQFEEEEKARIAEEERIAKEEEALRKKEEKEEEARIRREEREAEKNKNRLAKKARNKIENELMNIGLRSAKKILKKLLK